MSEILSPESPDKYGEMILTTMDQQASALNMHQVELYHEIMAARASKRLPQDARNQIEKEALNSKELAAKCVYALPRAGKPIKGPSIRFAEIIKNSWGNCRVHTRPCGSREEWIRDKAVEAESAFRDLEANTTHVITVRRRITDSHGNLFSDDMIGVTLAAAMAVAERNVILKCVPRSVWEPVYDAVEWAVKGDIKTFTENLEVALKAFADFGVKPEQVFPVLGLKGPQDLTIEHMVVLRGMYTALKDGSSTVEEMFDPRRHMRLAEPTTVDLASKLRGKRRAEGFAADNVANGLAGEVEEAASTPEEDEAAVEAAEAQKARKRRRKPKDGEKALAGGGHPKPKKRRQRPAQARGGAKGTEGQDRESYADEQDRDSYMPTGKAFTQDEVDDAYSNSPGPARPTGTAEAGVEMAKAAAKADTGGKAKPYGEPKSIPHDPNPPLRTPRTPEQYEAWVLAWVMELDPKQFRDRWVKEAAMRKKIGINLKLREDIWRRIVEPRMPG